MKIQDSINTKCSFYYLQQYNRINQTVSDIRENREQLCTFDLQYAKTLYNTPALSVGTYIHQELCNGLEKGLNRYQNYQEVLLFKNYVKLARLFVNTYLFLLLNYYLCIQKSYPRYKLMSNGAKL